MKRRLFWSVAAMLPVAVLFGTALVLLADEPARKTDEHRHKEGEHAHDAGELQHMLPRPIVDTHELMEMFNEPLYHKLKDLVGSQPTDKKGWAQIQEEALRAAEIVNLVAIRERAEGQEQKWQRLTKEAQVAALKLADAAKGRNWKSTTSAYRSLILNCNDCHQAIAPDHAPELEP
jgi:hypothetical protein